jgi:hypothetical protein
MGYNIPPDSIMALREHQSCIVCSAIFLHLQQILIKSSRALSASGQMYGSSGKHCTKMYESSSAGRGGIAVVVALAMVGKTWNNRTQFQLKTHIKQHMPGIPPRLCHLWWVMSFEWGMNAEVV